QPPRRVPQYDLARAPPVPAVHRPLRPGRAPGGDEPLLLPAPGDPLRGRAAPLPAMAPAGLRPAGALRRRPLPVPARHGRPGDAVGGRTPDGSLQLPTTERTERARLGPARRHQDSHGRHDEGGPGVSDVTHVDDMTAAGGFETDDTRDRRYALSATGVLGELNAAGLIEAADVHVASRLTRLTGETDDLVTATLAVLVRAVREGSTSLAPEHAREVIEPVVEDLPDDDTWLERVSAGALHEHGVIGVEHSLIYLDRYHREERQVAEDLARRETTDPPPVDDATLSAGLDRVFAGETWDEQRAAVRTAAGRLSTVLAGGPGTGKTSTVAGLLTLLLEQAEPSGRRPRIALAAPTGKAAARLRESVLSSLAHLPEQDRARLGTDIEAVTIHRLLGWRPDRSNRFRRDRSNPLPHDI